MKNSYDKLPLKRGSLAGIMLIIVAALTLEATSLTQFFFSRKGLREEASLRADGQLETTKAKIMDIINQAEASVMNSVWITEWGLAFPDSLQSICRRIVESNDVVMGSTIAMVPGYLPDRPLFSPYAMLDTASGGVVIKSLATEEYDYPSKEWFLKPLEDGKGYWSEPYIDEGGGDILMTTFSMPVCDYDGNQAAVLTADISLSWLTDLIGEIDVYPHAFSLMFSRSGNLMVCPVKDFIMNRNAWEMASEMDNESAARKTIESILSGKHGHTAIPYKGGKYQVYYEPVERSGWSMCIVIPDSEIYGKLRKIIWLVTFLQLFGLLMLALMLRAVARNQARYLALTENKEKMENELRIASEIQMSMIPKTFPPFPERSDIDMAAKIIPAKEVGGDMYDFHIRNEKLFFCVGDVSGKGVPASLVMAVTRSLFRTVSSREDDPKKIVTIMNDSMSEINENDMFVTFFCGVLDLSNGKLEYCNAGHNAPVILSDKKAFLPVDANLPLGIMKGMEYSLQEVTLAYDDAIFLYTDGVTEAENKDKELFGEERMMDSLSGRKDAWSHLQNISGMVIDFVGEAPQSDDITMLFIHYLK
ncbi:MAG: SpoIIE family protein phosphatase [Bacteroidales bacterium]|nr:SpoIIE family protein phosphatase [Bacteroidales bacterium]